MSLIFFDFETTGIDPLTARPLELGWVAAATGLDIAHSHYIWDMSYPSEWPEAEAVNRITPEYVSQHGVNPSRIIRLFVDMYSEFENPILVAHNGRNYDVPLLKAECARQGIPMPPFQQIDTMTDIPYPASMKCRKLSHLAIDHGILVDPLKLHGVCGDIELMKKILEKYPLEEVLKRSLAKRYLVQAVVSFADKDKAKERGYRWETFGNYKKPKAWIKEVLDFELEAEKKEAPFQVVVVI